MLSSAQSRPAPPRPRRRKKRHLSAWVWIIAFCLAALVATYVMFVEPPPPHKIIIASGSKDGAYFQFAQKYADELRSEGLSVEVRETAGSVENLRLLAEDGSGVGVAMVQSGVAGREDVERFYALGSLYHEPLWVFYRGDKRLERLSQLEGKRIGVGPEGSGTYAIAIRLLAANGLVDSETAKGKPRAVLVPAKVADAATALKKGDLDAACFVAAFEADYIQGLLSDSGVKLLSVDQHEAYHRRFRYLATVTIPAGMANLGQNIPAQDVALLAPTAMLVARKDFHPAVIPLLLATATRIHGNGDELSSPGEFPSQAYCDFPVSEDAKRFFASGQPVLQRLLPFGIASLVDRAKVMLIPLVMLLMPLLRLAPPLMRWRTRRKIYLWYSDLREIDQRLVGGLSRPELDQELARLNDIDHQVAYVDIPLSYMEEFYHLRLHLGMLQERLMALRAQSEQAGVSAGLRRLCLKARPQSDSLDEVGACFEEVGSFMPERSLVIAPPRTLVDGQRLDQPTFHALYEAMPVGTRAELINGVVLMSSPVGPAHGRAQFPVIIWLGYYVEKTPGLEGMDNTSTALGQKSEPQPDVLLRILPEYGGRTGTDRRFVHGVPELLVEVAHTSRYTDLGPKFEDYERARVLEYIVLALEPDEVFWFVLRGGRFVDLEPGADGIYRSEVFPGLWLDPAALLAGDTRRLRTVLDQGCATIEHTEFVARLAKARGV